MRINSLLIFCFLLCGAVIAQEKLSAKEVKRLEEDIQQKNAGINSLQGEFIQTKKLDFLQEPAKSSGKFFYKAPKQLKWIYLSPESFSLLFTNQKLFIEEEGNTKEIAISSNKLLRRLSQLIAKSINGEMLNDNSFTVNYHKEKQFIMANLIPKEEAIKDFIEQLVLYINPETLLVEKIKIMENAKDFTLISLEKIRVNEIINDAVFKP